MRRQRRQTPDRSVGSPSTLFGRLPELPEAMQTRIFSCMGPNFLFLAPVTKAFRATYASAFHGSNQTAFSMALSSVEALQYAEGFSGDASEGGGRRSSRSSRSSHAGLTVEKKGFLYGKYGSMEVIKYLETRGELGVDCFAGLLRGAVVAERWNVVMMCVEGDGAAISPQHLGDRAATLLLRSAEIAAKAGSATFLERLWKLPTFPRNVMQGSHQRVERRQMCEGAAMGGSVGVLSWLEEVGILCDTRKMVYWAVVSGQLEAAQWLMERSFKVGNDGHVLEAAVRGNNAAVLWFLRSRGVGIRSASPDWSGAMKSRLMERSFQEGAREAAKVLRQVGTPWPKQGVMLAMNSTDPAVTAQRALAFVQWARREGCPWGVRREVSTFCARLTVNSMSPFFRAQALKRSELFIWLHDNDFPCPCSQNVNP